MNKYRNLGGNSGVIGFDETVDSITVYFSSGHIYLYNSIKPGIQITETMKKLANQGSGLNSYIKKYVREKCYKIK